MAFDLVKHGSHFQTTANINGASHLVSSDVLKSDENITELKWVKYV